MYIHIFSLAVKSMNQLSQSQEKQNIKLDPHLK